MLGGPVGPTLFSLPPFFFFLFSFLTHFPALQIGQTIFFKKRVETMQENENQVPTKPTESVDAIFGWIETIAIFVYWGEETWNIKTLSDF